MVKDALAGNQKKIPGFPVEIVTGGNIIRRVRYVKVVQYRCGLSQEKKISPEGRNRCLRPRSG